METIQAPKLSPGELLVSVKIEIYASTVKECNRIAERCNPEDFHALLADNITMALAPLMFKIGRHDFVLDLSGGFGVYEQEPEPPAPRSA